MDKKPPYPCRLQPHLRWPQPRLTYKLENKLKTLRREVKETEQYLQAYDPTLINEMKGMEQNLKTYIEQAQKTAWFIEGMRQLKNQKAVINKDCRPCPFFQKWLKEAYQREFNVELIEVVENE